MPVTTRWHALAAAGLASLLLATLLDRAAPPPSADVARGSEDAFVRSGVYFRELAPRQPPHCWTSDRAVLHFANLPNGPATLVVAVHGQRGPVAVAAGGVVVGMLEPGAAEARYPLADVGRTLDVELRVPVFLADGRRLGAQLDRVALEPAPAGVPAVGLVLAVAIPMLALLLLGMARGIAPAWAALLALAVGSLECLALVPSGLVRSDYAGVLSAEIVVGALAASLFGGWMRDRGEGAAPWAFVALLAAILVQGVAATSPLMVVSDVVFHANKLVAVARGDFFPTSVTQHAQPFRIPYGASFYALLAPLVRWGLAPVTAVRAGAAVSGVLASAGLYALVVRHRPAAQAALAVIALQLLPGTFDVYSYGNLSNVFGQSVTVLFFAWWAGGMPGGPGLGAALLALGCTAHLSSFIVLVALVAALYAMGGAAARADRRRLAAVAIGFGLGIAYYAHSAGLIVEQLPRLVEGGGQGRGASQGMTGALTLQALGALGQWGIPAILVALVGRPRPSRGPFDRDLAAYAIASIALFLPAVLSPLDVRYLYALTLVVAAAAADGLVALSALGRLGRATAWALALWQVTVAARGLLEGLLTRYR